MSTQVSTGRFITLEGIDGSGKTCNLAYIKTLLVQAGKTVVCTREPGGTQLGEEIRTVLLRNRAVGMTPFSELLLLAAARAEHLALHISPALARGEWVLCDRFSDATYAYQGGGRGIATATLRTLETLVQDQLQPHLTILFDLPVEIGRSRARQRAVEDRIDQEANAFFQRVRIAYLERAALEPQRVRVIDAARPLIEVQINIKTVIDEFCNYLPP